MATDMLNYVLFTNPISSNVIDASVKMSQGLLSVAKSAMPAPAKPETKIVIKMDPEPLWKLAGRSNCMVRLAGLSGATAVMLGAYGAHSLLNDETKDDNLKKTFETANRYHFFHTIALLGVPLCKYPLLTGSLMVAGMTVFCGSCYYFALTGDHKYRRITPFGGTCLILGWLAMAL